jgi:hypothetical protein
MAVVVVMLPASSLEQESQQTAQSLALRVAPLDERAPNKSSEPPRKTASTQLASPVHKLKETRPRGRVSLKPEEQKRVRVVIKVPQLKEEHRRAI